MEPFDFTQDAVSCARALLGCELIVYDSLGKRGGIISETEAYTAEDAASHSYRGMTPRNEAMFMAPGTIYIYQIYGMHYCLNFVCGENDGQAVLIRSLIPTTGINLTSQNRNHRFPLTKGPANLVQALGLNKTFDKVHYTQAGLLLKQANKIVRFETSQRIGITKATDKKWRFLLV